MNEKDQKSSKKLKKENIKTQEEITQNEVIEEKECKKRENEILMEYKIREQKLIEDFKQKEQALRIEFSSLINEIRYNSDREIKIEKKNMEKNRIILIDIIASANDSLLALQDLINNNNINNIKENFITLQKKIEYLLQQKANITKIETKIGDKFSDSMYSINQIIKTTDQEKHNTIAEILSFPYKEEIGIVRLGFVNVFACSTSEK